jgi:FtsP/CotA-like multicopper oxidase with cupredoxin domain
MIGGRLRLVLASGATAALLGPLAWFWQDSLLPDVYSVMDMGHADTGGGPVHRGHGGGREVSTLAADPARAPDVDVTLTAREQRFTLASGREIDGYTFDGGSPGPTIRATVGQLVQVRLVNANVSDGVTLHWHGVDVPNAADGVAGVTQDAVPPGRDHVYRFVAGRAGTYWYHSHQMSHTQVIRGLLGALVVRPAVPEPSDVDEVALVHLYEGVRTVNGREGDLAVAAAPGDRARIRVVNTDNGPMSVWVAGAPYALVAIDGTEVRGPAPVRDRAVLVTSGGRADLAVTMPADGSGVRVHLGGPTGVVLGPAPPPARQPAATLDPLSYGTPAPLGFDPAGPGRTFRYDIGRRPGFLNGRPGMWWTVNGRQYPDTPMFVVTDGDVVRMRVSNHSGDVHPMHLHGHHAVVLARDGVPASGSPWWVDSLNVANGESYDVAFPADNPGIWTDHCHNLPHAAEGLVVHLMYEGVTTPYLVGGATGNTPE